MIHPIFGNLIEMYDIKKKIHVSPYSTGSAMLHVGSVRLLYTNMLVSATRNTCVVVVNPNASPQHKQI